MALPLLALASQLAPFILPKIAKALGGNKGEAVAETVVEIAEAVTGRKGQSAVDQVKADPKTALAFLQAQMAKEERLEELVVEDRRDARARDREFVKAGRWNFRADLMILACVVAMVFIVNEIGGQDIKPEVLAIYNMAIGALLKMLSDAFAFEFGSSRGSKEKDELLARK